MLTNNLCVFTKVMPSQLINAVACILEDVADSVRVFGVTRRTKVPYVSYVNKAGRVVSGFVKREILSKFKGIHVGFKNKSFILTNLETGEQTVIELKVGDMVEVVGDRYDKRYIWENGKVTNISPDGWISVNIDRKVLEFRAAEDLVPQRQAGEQAPAPVTEKAPAHPLPKNPAKGARLDWSQEPDDVVFAAAAEAKRDLGF